MTAIASRSATAQAAVPREPGGAGIGDRGRLVILGLATGLRVQARRRPVRLWTGYRPADLPGWKVSADRAGISSCVEFSIWVIIDDGGTRPRRPHRSTRDLKPQA